MALVKSNLQLDSKRSMWPPDILTPTPLSRTCTPLAGRGTPIPFCSRPSNLLPSQPPQTSLQVTLILSDTPLNQDVRMLAVKHTTWRLIQISKVTD